MTDVSGTLGDSIARGIVDAQLAAHHEHKGLRHDERIEFMEHLERLLSEAFKELGIIDPAGADLSPEARAMLAPIHEPSHAVDFLFNAVAYIGVAFTGALAASAGINQQLTERALYKHADIKPDASVTAGMQARGIIDDGTANTWYQDVGTKGAVAQAWLDGAWAQFPPATVLELARRRIIDIPRAEAILRLNGFTPESVQNLLLLTVGPPDASTLVAAVTQSQITPGEFADLLPQVGIDGKWANVIFQTAGQSPPPELAGRLFREGWVDEALYKKMLLESPLKNQYVDVLANLRFRFPPMRTTLKMFADGLIDAPTAQTYLEKLGFFPVDAANLVKSAAKHQSTSVKNLSPSTVEKLYARGKYDRATAMSTLEALGYDATEAGLLLDLVDDDRSHGAMDRAATSIGTRYTSWKIDRAEAVTLLDRINVPAADRDDLLEIWDARRDAQTLHLSEAFLHKAFKANKISRDDVQRRLLAMGYDATDTAIILATDFPPTAAEAKAKDLSRADQVKRYSEGIIDKATLRGLLVGLGYDPAEADQIIELADRKLAATAGNGAAP
jgi:Holliday junction resolvasome RuvABC DNA-binding subunit